MDNETHQFEDFLLQVPPQGQAFAIATHARLTGEGYKCKIENKANGFLVSYGQPKTRRVILNFLARKKGLYTRIYGDHCGAYADFLRALPGDMEKEIAGASNCKRLLDPADCNSRCPMGYDFAVGENAYKKCRYSCFQFLVTPESIPVIEAFIEKERGARRGA